MDRRSFKLARECCCFCAVIQICAIIAATAATTKLTSFVHHLAGFTLLLQGAAVVNVLIYIGCRRCLHLTKHKVSNTTVWGTAGLAGLAAHTGILAAYGQYLPGTARELPLAMQLAGVAVTLGVSLYMARLHRRNRWLLHSENEAHKHLSIKQLRHHFLFNALNTTVYLVKRQPDVAIRILTDLSGLFRVMLQQKSTATLTEEIEFVRRYTRIERERLGPRLGVEWQLPDAKYMCTKMPTMVIQPLVENAIYHGVETCEKGGIIQITIKARKKRVFFNICNPVGNTVLVNRREGNRIAQKSVRDRLLHAYGSACHYTCKQRHGEYCVAFSIPKEDIDECIDCR